VDDTLTVLDSQEMVETLSQFNIDLIQAIDNKINSITSIIQKSFSDYLDLTEVDRKKTFASQIKNTLTNAHEKTVILKSYDEIVKDKVYSNEEEMREIVESELMKMLKLRLNKKVEEARQLLGTDLKFTPKKSFFGESL
jgi:hypothetical protein